MDRARSRSCLSSRSSEAAASLSRLPTLDDVFLALTGRSLREAENTENPQDSPSRKDAA